MLTRSNLFHYSDVPQKGFTHIIIIFLLEKNHDGFIVRNMITAANMG